MRDDPARRSSKNIRRALLWAECGLVGAGAVLLAWVALLYGDAWMFQQLARDAMAATPSVTVPSSVSARPLVIIRGAPIGELSIPRVQLSAMVLQGSDARTLRRGPGHLENTALPGRPGNVAIAGHRDSFFRPIRDVRIGDDIFVDTTEGRFHYRVSSLGVVDSTDVSVLDPTAAATLTLITCYPFTLVGPAPDRFIVRAAEVARVDTASPFAGAAAVTTIDETPAQAEPATWRTPAAVRVPPPGHRSAAAGVEQMQRDDRRDEALVRQAVERFRLVYNARLTRLADRRDGEPLSLKDCAVALNHDEAAATCADASPQAEMTGVWNFTLRAADGAWAISSVEPK